MGWSAGGPDPTGGGGIFSFSKTSHSLSVNSYLRENQLNLPFVSFVRYSSSSSYMEEGGGGVYTKLAFFVLFLQSLPSVVDSSDGAASMAQQTADITATYPLVCRSSSDNVKSVYSLVLTFARVIESQPVSGGIQGLSVGTDVDYNSTAGSSGVAAVTTASGGRRMLPAPSQRISRMGRPHGLKSALLAMGAQKVAPKA